MTHRQQKHGCVKPILFLLIMSATGAYILNTVIPDSSSVISPLPDEYIYRPPLIQLFKKEKNPEKLREFVKNRIGEEWKNYSVLVADYRSPLRMEINETGIYPAASVNKVPILAALYMEVALGNADFDKVITIQADDIQDYGTGSIRYDPPGTTYSVRTLARLMMQKSDNTAAYVIANYIVGLKNIQNYVDQWGLTQTDMYSNKTSNKDMEILFRKIMDKKITTAALSEELIGLLKDSDFEDRIPALLPDDVTVFHKIGTGTGAVHDVGVVTKDNTLYYIGILTQDVGDEEQAAKLASEVSKVVFEFMNTH